MSFSEWFAIVSDILQTKLSFSSISVKTLISVVSMIPGRHKEYRH